MIEPFVLPGDEEVTEIDTDWLFDDYVMTLRERQIRNEDTEEGDSKNDS